MTKYTTLCKLRDKSLTQHSDNKGIKQRYIFWINQPDYSSSSSPKKKKKKKTKKGYYQEIYINVGWKGEDETRFIGNIKEKEGREMRHSAQMYLPVENNNRVALSRFYRASTRSSSANKK